jgi:hypothetical protein
MSSFRDAGESDHRCADRQFRVELNQPPPRNTRSEPVDGPGGSPNGECL